MVISARHVRQHQIVNCRLQTLLGIPVGARQIDRRTETMKEAHLDGVAIGMVVDP